MPDFSGKTIMSVYKFTIRHKTTPYAGSKCHHDKVIHTLGGSIHHLSNGSSIRIIGDR